MQLTIYYTDEDKYLVDKVEAKAHAERRSRSSVILTILEQYFESNRRLGEILCDLQRVSTEKIDQALELQKREAQKGHSRKLGEILLTQRVIREQDLARALAIQGKANGHTVARG